MEISNNINAMQTYSNRLNDNAQELANAAFENQAKTTNENTTAANEENSNDIARNLTDNISLQNGLDAQVRSINTSNQILGTVLDIKS